MKIMFIANNYIIDPLGIGFLSHELKKHGHSVGILKYNNNQNKIRSILIKRKPDILAYSLTTGQHRQFLDLNVKVKRKGMISCFGGPHATFFPEMIKERGVDAIFRGEAEETFVKFCNYIRDNKSMPLSINGVDVKLTEHAGGMYVRNIAHRLPLVLDNYSPDRDLMYSFKENLENPIRNFMVS